jgi:hypothetical protein
MPTEQEELKLVVSLVDNASPGLDKIIEKSKEMGGTQMREAHHKMAGASNILKGRRSRMREYCLPRCASDIRVVSFHLCPWPKLGLRLSR